MINNAASLPTIDPRYMDFKNACSLAEWKIRKKLVEPLQAEFTAQMFYAINITEEGQEKLRSINDRVKTLMLKILADLVAYCPTYCIKMFLMGRVLGDESLFGKMFKEKALPIVMETVEILDQTIPGIIDEVVADGLDLDQRTVLGNLHII